MSGRPGAMTLLPGQTLGHYKIHRKIGEGGMGAVYLAEDTKLKRRVALKVLPEAVTADAARRARFEREAQVVAALNHPHVVTLHSVEEEGGVRFLTMELVEGESLDRTLPKEGLPLGKIFDVGIALADALAAAHEKGILHRDLKPGNVMVTEDGRIKVLDFGLAKVAVEKGDPQESGSETTSAPTRTAELTTEGSLLGTIPYMSPEQVQAKPLDHRTDLFSLGVILYEMATGSRPFEGTNQAELISSIMRDTPSAVTAIRPELPRHLGRIIAHCLQKEPRERFQTARDVSNELRALQDEVKSGPESSGVTPRDGVAAAARSRRAPWIVLAAILALIAAAAAWLGRRAFAPASGAATMLTATPAPAAVAATSSIAVLPFADLSPDKDQEYFSDGLTEELLSVLAKIPELKVAGRTSSFSFKGKSEDLRTIGEKLGVAHILEGSVRKVGKQLRITAQLVKAADGFQLWSETYDRTLADIFAVQDDIARSVARELQVALQVRGAEAPRPNTEAYDLVLQARFVMQNATEESVRRGREIMGRALSLAPGYAPVWAGMGLVHRRENFLATTAEERQQANERARRALAKALELDPGLAIAHSRMAGVQHDAWEFAAAERSHERALAAGSKDPIVMGNAAIFYDCVGRRDEAIALQERRLDVDPLDLNGYTNLASSYTHAGRLDEAEARLRRVLELAPDFAWAHVGLGKVHLLRGDVEEARATFARFQELAAGGDYWRIFFDAIVEHSAGNATASASAAMEFERRFGASDPTTCAEIRAWRGDAGAAFAWLDRALELHDPGLASIKDDFYLIPLHVDPRWNTLLERIGLPTD